MGVDPSSKATLRKAEILKKLKENHHTWENTRPMRTRGWDKLQTQPQDQEGSPGSPEESLGLGQRIHGPGEGALISLTTDNQRRKATDLEPRFWHPWLSGTAARSAGRKQSRELRPSRRAHVSHAPSPCGLLGSGKAPMRVSILSPGV